MQSSYNILYDQSVLTLVYNVIHWILGFGILLFALFEYKRVRKKNEAKKYNLTGPVILQQTV